MEPDVAPLASLSQIQQTPSRTDGVPPELEEDLRAYGAKLIQQAGILLKQSVPFPDLLSRILNLLYFNAGSKWQSPPHRCFSSGFGTQAPW